jgi:release factor glutamine methyltransferase
MRLDAAIQEGAARLSEHSESPRLDAEILLCRSIDMPRSYLFAHPDDELDADALQRFRAVLKRRVDKEPIAYILGTREFWSHDFMVSPATLVPRPETELLVDLALREIPRKAAWKILDLGTGSGAIAISIASERPMCEVTATDVSAAALAIAAENARQANLANVTCRCGDWTAAVRGGEFDLVVSNPPYIRQNDAVLHDLRHEPRSALVSGADGLDAIRVLAVDCGPLLVTNGWLMMEHGADQQHDVAALLATEGWLDVSCHNDLAGLPRVTAARWSGT